MTKALQRRAQAEQLDNYHALIYARVMHFYHALPASAKAFISPDDLVADCKCHILKRIGEGKFDRSRGAFSNFVHTLCTNFLMNVIEYRRKPKRDAGTEDIRDLDVGVNSRVLQSIARRELVYVVREMHMQASPALREFLETYIFREGARRMPTTVPPDVPGIRAELEKLIKYYGITVAQYIDTVGNYA